MQKTSNKLDSLLQIFDLTLIWSKFSELLAGKATKIQTFKDTQTSETFSKL